MNQKEAEHLTCDLLHQRAMSRPKRVLQGPGVIDQAALCRRGALRDITAGARQHPQHARFERVASSALRGVKASEIVSCRVSWGDMSAIGHSGIDGRAFSSPRPWRRPLWRDLPLQSSDAPPGQPSVTRTSAALFCDGESHVKLCVELKFGVRQKP